MGLWDLFERLTTMPEAEPIGYRCLNCSADVAGAESACPECGGEVEEVLPEPMEFYWPHH